MNASYDRSVHRRTYHLLYIHICLLVFSHLVVQHPVRVGSLYQIPMKIIWMDLAASVSLVDTNERERHSHLVILIADVLTPSYPLCSFLSFSGCAANNPAGLHLAMEVHSKEALFRTVPFVFSHAFSGFPNTAHGAIQGAAMDCLAEWACMYLMKSIGFTTQFHLDFLKPTPAAPPTSYPHTSVAHAQRDIVLPQMLGLQVQIVCSARKQVHPRSLVLDLILEDAYGLGKLYTRGVVYMLLPSEAQVMRLFGSADGGATAKQVQQSLDLVPRPNQLIMPQQQQRSESSSVSPPQKKQTQQAANGSSTSKSSPTSFADLVSPATTPGDIDESNWILLPDAPTLYIPDFSCYGCSSGNPHGMQCRFSIHRRSGAVRTLLCPSASLAGFPGMLHGGAALIPLDCAASWALKIHVGKLMATSTMDILFISSAPVPRINQRKATTNTSMIEPSHTHSHSDGHTCSSSSSSSNNISMASSFIQSPALVPPSESIYQLMIQAEIVSISSDGRDAIVVANLYDVSTKKSPPRLCMSSRMSFRILSDFGISRIHGERFIEPIRNALNVLKEIKQNIQEENKQKGIIMKQIQVENKKSTNETATTQSKL
jgi:acyl-coenzyme A thioesterase PaaI-like protein